MYSLLTPQAEARKLALMADRMDSPKSPMGGLSIWVALATFFSSSTERERVKEAVGREKAERREGRGDGGEDGRGRGQGKGDKEGKEGRGGVSGTEYEVDTADEGGDGDGGNDVVQANVQGDEAEAGRESGEKIKDSGGRRWSRVFGL